MHDIAKKPHAKHLHPLQVIEVNDILRQIVVVNDAANRVVSYQAGHSDETVAKQLGLTTNQVARQRQLCFGRLYVRGKASDERSVEQRLVVLEQRVAELVQMLEDLTTH